MCSVDEMAQSQQHFLKPELVLNRNDKLRMADRQLSWRRFLEDNKLIFVTLSGVLLGVIIGFSLRPLGLSTDAVMLIAYPGELFMRVLKLMILPLVIASLISGSSSLNAKLNGKIALRTFVYFLVTSLLNAILGTVLALAIHPGNPNLEETVVVDATVSSPTARTVSLMDSILDLGRNIFPDNIFQAALQQAHTVYVPSKSGPALLPNDNSNASTTTSPAVASLTKWSEEPNEWTRVVEYRPGTNSLGIVFFCLVFGTLLGTIGSRGYVVVQFFSAIFEVIMRMVTGVMWLTPIGISSLIAGKILSVEDIAFVMTQLAWFIFTIALGVLLYQWVILQAIYFVFLRKNPFKFYLGLVQPILTGFATASTAAALPLTFRCMNERLKIDSRITRFVLPIGCNINMDGTALFIAVASIFVAQMSNMMLNAGQIVTVILTSTAASMSSASIPSAALVLLLIALSAIDAPINNATILFAVDWFVDRIRTTNNLLGDCYAAAIVEYLSRHELQDSDIDAYYKDDDVTSDDQCDPEANGKRKSSFPNSVILNVEVSTPVSNP
ncbi:excitatory amino acid transporter-like [Anopheles albimanus]|uniref:Amino acid transporter n=1 Tax=Anopheles albimanus TaxID=7167 RepID=A0A182F4I2_ANOAL|nr:excitatory amino acid transporter-like [Anopheles albimanus]XP_035776931.1 excitatory amino acid transporter-like [Anopheles albimanus]